MTSSSRVIVFSVLLIALDCACVRAGETPKGADDWLPMPQFYALIKSNICDLDTAAARPRGDVLGLNLSDASPDAWCQYAKWHTNIIYLRVESGSDTIPTDVLENCQCFPHLRYLYLRMPKAGNVPAAIALLTNVITLEYLTVQAKKATNVSRQLYAPSSIKGLELYLGAVCLPDGISILTKLRRLDLLLTPVECLPSDLPESRLLEFSISRAKGIDKLLPRLPPELVSLDAIGCGLKAIPDDWLHQSNLSRINLNDNRIAVMPSNLTGLPALKEFFIEDNAITKLPALHLPAADDLKLRLFGNPLKEVDKSNAALVRRGVLQYDGDKSSSPPAAR
jgi:Leucine-rich repeat (LRR) protein